jgi:hypothetical protein
LFELQEAFMPPVPVNPEERLRLVAKRARELYEARGGTDGADPADWLQAEREMAIVEAIVAAAARLAELRLKPASPSRPLPADEALTGAAASR